MQTALATTLMLLFFVGAHARPQNWPFGGSFQNCQGSQCNQNNAGGSSGGGGRAQNCLGSQCNQNNGGGGGFSGFPSTFFNNHVQNCQESRCNQNNAGGGFGGFPFGK